MTLLTATTGETRVADDTRSHSAPATAATKPAPIVWYRRDAVQRRVRLVSRLLEMGPAEIAHRGWRAAAKRAARRHGGRADVEPRGLDAATLLTPAMAVDPASYFTHRTTASGFFALDERAQLVAIAHAELQAQVEDTVRAAESILTEGIDLLGRHFHPAAADFDWCADPDLGRVWPSTVLDDSDAVRHVRADVKFVWEVNRHQFLVTLARAFAYSGDPRFARAAAGIVARWIDANPPGVGVNWASNLEVAVRSLSWVWALHFLLGAPALAADELRGWLVSLRQHRDHLVRHLSTYTDPTNHLIGEAAALAVLAIWLPEWPDSAALRDLALATLDRELTKQVGDDGVDREQATGYQRFVLDFALQVVALAARNRIALPESTRLRAAAMLSAVRVLLGAAWRAPRIGDGDDGRGLPFGTGDVWDFGELLAAGAAVLGSEPGAAPFCESALWLGGVPYTAPAAPAAPPRSTVLPGGGYAVLHSRAHAGRDRLVFDCGPLGYPPHASHGHADILSIIVDLDGEELLVDPGTFAYYDERGRRDVFRATRAHNTVEVGGRDQADAFDPFKWLNLPRVGRDCCHLGAHLDYVEGWHDGYRRLRPAVRHRRGVIGVAGGWVIIDWLEGRGMHQFIRWFHLAPRAAVERVDESALRLWTPSRRSALAMRDIGGDGASAATVIDVSHAPYSERYNGITEAPVVRFADQASLPALRMTLLAAEHGSSAPQIAIVDRIATPDRQGIWLRLQDAEGATVQIAARTTEAPERLGPVLTDARAVITRRGQADSVAEVISSGGTRVHEDDAG